MARGKKQKQIDGQLCLFDFCTDSSNYVVQANTLIGGKQALKLNSAKLIRAAIMQVVKEDTELKPFLINLKEHYTQYTLQEVLAMKSVYAIRIFEMIQSRIMSPVLPKEGIELDISVQEIKECCDCVDKYSTFSNFKVKVLDKAKEEINRITTYCVDYSYIKKARSVIAIRFHINMCYHMF